MSNYIFYETGIDWEGGEDLKEQLEEWMVNSSICFFI